MGITLELATGKKAKKQKPERLTISSPITKVVKEGQKKATKVPVVDVAIALKQQIENLEGELKNYRSQIISETSAKRDEELAAKNFVKTVDVEGTNAKIQVQFQDRYSKLDASMETPLRDIFDDKFEQMFKVDTKETLKKSKMAELKEILGDTDSKISSIQKLLLHLKAISSISIFFWKIRWTTTRKKLLKRSSKVANQHQQ